MEALRHCLPSSVRGILDELPESLDETYERVLKSINKSSRDHAHRLLQCLTVAVRPLRVEELAEVLAIDFDAARHEGIAKIKPDWRWADQHQAILSTCHSLVAIVGDGGSQVVQFSHFSVKEFLTSDRLARSSGEISRYHIPLSPAHTVFAQACLCVLLRLHEVVTWYDVIPLASYAARYWVVHAQFEDVSSHIRDAMECLFDVDKPHWEAWHCFYNIDDISWSNFNFSNIDRVLDDIPWSNFNPDEVFSNPDRVLDDITWSDFNPDGVFSDVLPLYYAALCGFYDLTKQFIAKNPEHVNARGGRMMTPLVAALNRNHFLVADLLHQHGADVDARDQSQWTLLHEASFTGLVDVVEWLLDHGADVNARNVHGSLPLHMASECGRLETCRVLLERNADINSRGRWGVVPLHFAAAPNHAEDMPEILRLLLDRGADANARDDDGCTPLHYSSWWEKESFQPCHGTIEGSRLLLDYGADINAKNNEGKTPLRLAEEAGRHEMVEFLSGLGAQ